MLRILTAYDLWHLAQLYKPNAAVDSRNSFLNFDENNMMDQSIMDHADIMRRIRKTQSLLCGGQVEDLIPLQATSGNLMLFVCNSSSVEAR